MKFEIEKDVFVEALSQVQNVVSSRSTLPVLSNVLIEADDQGLTLSTTDMDVSITRKVAAKVSEAGVTTLPVRKLVSIVREMIGGDISIDVSEEHTATLSAGPSVFKIMGMPKDDFPELAQFGDDAKEFTLDQVLLRGALRKTSYAISTDETRYVLNGVNCLIGDGLLCLVATDGRRLAMVEQDLEFPGGENFSAIIPTKAVLELQRGILKDEGEVKVTFTSNQAAFEVADTRLISKLIEGNYPNFRQVIPQSSNHRVTVSRDLLLDAVKRVGLLANEKTNSIKFTFRENVIDITSNSPDVGEANEQLDVKYDGPEMSLAFNPDFVMAPLKNLHQDEVYIDLIDGNSPGVIKIDEPFLYVIMPMRVAS